MAVVPWEQQLSAIIGSTTGTNLRIYNSDEQPEAGKMTFIYGRPGVGKTDLTAALADCKYALPLVYINVDGGAWVFKHRKDITIIDIQEWTDYSSLIVRMYQAPSLPFKTMLVDNGSELQARNILDIVKQKGTGGIRGSGMPSQPNYGSSTAQMLNMFRLCDDMCDKFGIHCVFIAWEDARKDSITNQMIKSGIGFTPAVARAVPYIADFVGHLTVQDDPPYYTRVLNFAPTPHSDAKFRASREGVETEIPLTIAYRREQHPLTDIFNTILGGEKWPKARYANLAGQAKVTYAKTAYTGTQPDDDDTMGVVEQLVTEKLSAIPQTNEG